MQLTDYAVLALYFIVMMAIGLWAMSRVRNQEDYFLGGRSFGRLLQTFAAFGSGTGAHEPITVGRTIWTSGLSGVWSALMWLFVTPVYWITAVWYRRMRHFTLGDWFVERYQSRSMGVAYTLFAIAFYMTYLSTMFSAVAKFAVPLMGIEQVGGIDLAWILIPAIAIAVAVYGVLGGLTAAYWTDLVQGIFIVLLSILLIPFGLIRLSERFGNGEGMMDGFRQLHERMPETMFRLLDGPSAGEFPIHYIISLTVLALVGIVVQPHFIATGGGSAKDEWSARVGLVTGNFLKRLCTVGWALAALIGVALLADRADIAGDPDQLWGIAAREVLGPLNVGLVGLMLACLLAAMMSSADTYMLVTSALVVRNVYVPCFRGDASEAECIRVGRAAGILILVGASTIALLMSDVFAQFRLAIELPILFAAPFWLGMVWRRVTASAVWGTMAFSLLLFFLLPSLIPMALPGLADDERWSAKTATRENVVQRTATAMDVERRAGWEAAMKSGTANENSFLKVEPPVVELGQPMQAVRLSGGERIFWRGSKFNVDAAIYAAAGIQLDGISAGWLETLRLPPRLLLPFGLMWLLSLFTKPPSRDAVDRYFAKMRTPVLVDPQQDQQAIEQTLRGDASSTSRKLFPHSQWEFDRPTATDVIGFLICVVVCFLIAGLLVWLAGIGGGV